MKQTRLWLTTIATLLCSVTASAHHFKVGGIYYNITSEEDLTVEVTYRGFNYDSHLNEYSGAVTIPEAVIYNNKTYSVTSIGYAAFKYCSSLTSITIPEGVTSIGYDAFQYCTSLTAITIPEGVTSIGWQAFLRCSSLASIVVAKGNTVFDSRNGCNAIIITSSNTLIQGCSATIIPEDVTSIEDWAFYGCSRLTSINIPEGVTSIGSNAFEDCSSLTAITIPEGVTSIEYHAFYGCSSLTAITIPESVTSIGDYAFYNCSSLTAITIPEGVTSIGSYAFSGCSSLYKVINYSNLSLSKGSSSNGYVAYYAKVVYKESYLTTVDDFQFYTSDGIHALVNYIGNDAEIVLPDSYNGENYKIGSYAFSGCRETAITIPESVTSIGHYAFNNCTALKKVIIEDGSTTLSLGYNDSSQGLFYDCPLEEVYWGRNLSYSSDQSYGYSPFYDKDALTKVTIGNEVTEIGQDAFRGCDNIHSLVMGNGVLSIGSNAFSTPDKVIWLTNTPPTGYTNIKGDINYAANDQYSSLSNVKVYPYLSSMFEVDGVKYVPVSPSERTCHAIDCAYDSTATAINVGETALFKGVAMKVTEVMPYTFYGNDHIEEVSVSHLGNIGDYAFCDCDAIKTVEVSNNGDIGEQAFYNCDAIETVNVSNQGNIGSQAFYDCDGIKSVDISNRGSIGYQAFYGCNGMETANVTNKGAVGNEAFSGCSSLKTVTLGDSIDSLGDKAFYQCTNLQAITIPNTVLSIGTYCFGYLSLSEISIPQSVMTVGDYAFQGCTQLADVIIEDRTTTLTLGSNGSSPLFVDCPLDSVYIGGKITYSTTSSKGYSPFYRNTSLRTVVITNREEQIYDNEFYGCTNLKSVTIGNGVKSIGDYAFSGCSSLDGFSFGSNMESIGAEAFSDCTNLTTITSHAAVPPTCGTQALDDINKWSCTLRVPSGYAAAYQAADQWKEFFFIEDVVEVDHYVLTYVVDGEVYHTDTLVHKATIVLPEAPTKEGYTFSGWSEAPETMPAEDITISGTFTINKYLVTFKIGDEVIAADSLEYGATIVAPEAPEREGHTFNGWGEVTETVPAGDVTYEGSYTVNIYKVYYYVGEELVHTAEVAYGEKIPEYIYEPTKEGDVLEGWTGEPYDTMPAHDVTYTANITNGIEQLTNAKGQLTIYDLNGRKIEVEDLRELLRGIYIVNGHRVLLGD